MTNKNLKKVLLSRSFTLQHFEDAPIYLNSEKQIAVLPVEQLEESNLTLYRKFLTTYRDKSFRALLIPEEVWTTKNQIVTSQIQVYSGQFQSVHARLCQLQKIDSDLACSFLDTHHLLGCTKGYYHCGIFLNQSLTGVALFGRPLVLKYELGQPTSYELIRYCSKKGTVIQGGLSKALKHFIDEHQPDELMTSVDLGFSSGQSFKMMGFEPKEITAPFRKGNRMVSIGNLRLTKSYQLD